MILNSFKDQWLRKLKWNIFTETRIIRHFDQSFIKNKNM